MDAATIIALGYAHPRKLPSGEWAAALDFLFTTGLVVGIEELGYRTRFCYPTNAQARAALMVWDGQADPPGPWIKEKGPGVDRSNPNRAHFQDIPLVIESAEQGEIEPLTE